MISYGCGVDECDHVKYAGKKMSAVFLQVTMYKSVHY